MLKKFFKPVFISIILSITLMVTLQSCCGCVKDVSIIVYEDGNIEVANEVYVENEWVTIEYIDGKTIRKPSSKISEIQEMLKTDFEEKYGTDYDNINYYIKN